MDKKRASETGIRMEIIEGTNEAVAVDKLVDDVLHNRTSEALGDLHEPHHDASATEAE
ncbi:MAG: hypothetical protein GX862_03735 [Leucobacter sp.]|nr:hypothetical protein [Leucobacter sp.]